MAKTKISEYSATPASNTDISNINIAEGCSPANVNNAIRSLMAQLKDQQDGTGGDPFTVAGTLTASGTLTSSGTLAVTGGLTLDGAAGTSGQALVSAGTSNTPTWSTLGTITTQNANAVTITGGTLANVTISGTSPLTGSTAISALTTAGETTTVSATAATGTINYDLLTQSVLYYTSNASGNWTLNVRGNSSTTLNSVMATGEARTIAFLVPQGSTAYYQSGFTIDGTSVTPKWQNGTTISSGNVSGIDIYVLTIIKTASATYTVLESQTKFA